MRVVENAVPHPESTFPWWKGMEVTSLAVESECSENSFHEIVGDGPALKRMLTLAMKVARSEGPVLILGEAGSGKELIARAIHRISVRRNESFVKVNCARAAEGNLAAELFGEEVLDDPASAKAGGVGRVNLAHEVAFSRPDHQPEPPSALTREEFERLEGVLFANEKGAEGKTGKTGYLELAHKGILFLDEIEHLPLDVQAMLLRLLERREFERPGSTHSIQVNVRLITTTKCDLGERVAEQLFRSDLYDQLNLFPIRVPPLRERREDIPLLARYFMQMFARRLNKHIATIPAETMSFLANSDWPGNVRQLENLIEQSVVLTEGSALRVPLVGLQPQSEAETG
jgi:formate hydrogenlyase transcriptional activator